MKVRYKEMVMFRSFRSWGKYALSTRVKIGGADDSPYYILGFRGYLYSR